MARKTPPLWISGAFILRDPFEVDVNTAYTVIALRSFDELIARGQDPLKLIYEPVGLTQSAYVADKAEGASVVCMRDKSGKLMYVPDTYIEAFPSMGSVPYSRLVVGVSMGMWPDDRDMTDIEQAIKESVKAKTGVDPVIFLTRASTSDYVSESQHAQLVATRQNGVTDTETDTAKIIRLSDEIAQLKATIEEQDLVIQALAGDPGTGR